MYRKYLTRPWDYRHSDVETGATSGFLSPAQNSNHAIARVRCSLAAGVDLALMKSHGMIPGNQRLMATGARVIDDKAGMTDNPAAHALPCGISVIGRGPVFLLPKPIVMQQFLAEPYKYTNIIPRSANAADHRAEAFNRKDGTGLVGSFLKFSQRVVDTAATHKGAVDRGALSLAFTQLMADYVRALEIAMENSAPVATGRLVMVPGQGMMLNPGIERSDDEIGEENIRTALRGQIMAMKEFESALFSSMLVQEVESDFHGRLKESGV